MVNTFLIGVQKAGTTSLYDWIAQHPQVEGSWPLKDIPVFVDPDFKYDEEWLNKQYISDTKIYIHGSVEYFFNIELFLDNISSYINSGAKLILILRNPVERAFSWYAYALKSNMVSENETMRFNLDREKKILDDINGPYNNTSRKTPIHYGFYAKNLQILINRVPSKQIKVLIYEEFFSNKEEGIRNIYNFLDIDDGFIPKFKKINVRGMPRIKNISILWNNAFSQKILKPIIPYKRRQRMVKYVTEKNTKPAVFEFTEKESSYLKKIYKDDILETENILDKKLNEWRS